MTNWRCFLSCFICFALLQPHCHGTCVRTSTSGVECARARVATATCLDGPPKDVLYVGMGSRIIAIATGDFVDANDEGMELPAIPVQQ